MDDLALLEELVLESGLEYDIVDTIRSRDGTVLVAEEIQELDLSNLGIQYLPDIIGDFSNLRRLNLSDNQIEEFTPALLDLTRLEYIDLRSNPFTFLPIGLHPLFDIIQVESNKIPSSSDHEVYHSSRIPSDQSIFSSDMADHAILEELVLEMELDLDMVDIILQRPNTEAAGDYLISLDLSGLGIRYIPDMIAQLEELEVLDLSDNNIVDVSPALLDMFRLQLLDLTNNSFVNVPAFLEPIFDKIVVERHKFPKMAADHSDLSSISDYRTSSKNQRYYIRVQTEVEKKQVEALLDAARERRCCRQSARLTDKFCTICGRSVPQEWYV